VSYSANTALSLASACGVAFLVIVPLALLLGAGLGGLPGPLHQVLSAVSFAGFVLGPVAAMFGLGVHFRMGRHVPLRRKLRWSLLLASAPILVTLLLAGGLALR